MFPKIWQTCKIDKTGSSFHIHARWFLIVFTIALVTLVPTTMARLGPHHPGGPVRKIHSSHSHHVPTISDDGYTQKITADRQLLHDKEHLKEDIGEWLFADGKEMSPEEMEFHYFRMHDFDNNTQLDGLEILQALIHVLPIDEMDPDDSHIQKHAVNYESNKKPVIHEGDFNYYIDLIDTVFEQDDLNRDGLLSYPEYVVGRRKLDGKDLHRAPMF